MATSLCRVCLTGDIRMFKTKNIHLLQIYEKLANAQLNAEDGRPSSICYICYSQLQKCRMFSEKAQQSERHLKDILFHSTEVTFQMITDLNLATKPNLSVTIPKLMSVDDGDDDDSSVNKSSRKWSLEAGQRRGYRDVSTYEGAQVTVKEEKVIVKEETTSKEEVFIEIERIDNLTGDRSSVERSEVNYTDDKKTSLDDYNDIDDSPKFACKECGKEFALTRYLKQHMVVHSEARPFTCIVPPCTKTFARKSDLNRHVKRHSELKSGFSDQSTKLEKSEAKVETIDKPFACTQCNKKFTLQRYLHQHIITHSRSRPLHKCSVCNKVFSRKFLLDRHALTHSKPRVRSRTRRPDDRPYHCDICGRQFKMNTHLTSHMRRHTGERPYSCHQCGKTFRYECNLRIHMKAHTGQKPHTCHVCRKPFMLKGNLKQHMQTHTGERPFPCNLCDKRFTQKCSLKLHMQFHSGEKTHACNVCDKTFFRVCYLKRHMLGHSGDRPYACDRCDKDYTDPSTLRIHQRVHTGERPYACETCGATFTRSHHLKQHTSSAKCSGGALT